MKRIVFILLLVLLNFLDAKEIFTKDKIQKYLTLKNPFIYSAIGQNKIYKSREKFQLGAFDTKISAKYDDKEYPLTKGKFTNLALSKATQNGVELSLAYRKATGTQEYNNIKTSKDGEAIIGVKIPVFSLTNNINTKKYNLNKAQLAYSKVSYKSQNNLRLLYFKIYASYHTLLYQKSLMLLVDKLFQNTLIREKIIQKRVVAGSLAELSLLEAKQQIINAKQRLLTAKNSYNNALEKFLTYLNSNKKSFLTHYRVPELFQEKKALLKTEEALMLALKNRADVKAFLYDKKLFALEYDYSKLLKYPKFNVGVYGVHDFKYNNGFKISLDMSFPIERRKYEGKNLEIKSKMTNTEMLLQKRVKEIALKISTINNSLIVIKKNIINSKREIFLVQKLEDAQKKKYKLGLSNLFMVNQREIYTLNIKKKLLQYILDYNIFQEQIKREIGRDRDL